MASNNTRQVAVGDRLRCLNPVQTFETVWDAIADGPEEAEAMRKRSDAIIAAEGYPDGNPKTRLGTSKPGIRAVPAVALYKLGQAMADGERKYGLYNWREHTVSSSVYFEAAMRHLWAFWDGEDEAKDSGVDHLAHVMGCMAILLDARDRGKLNDDRTPHRGGLPRFIAQETRVA